MLYTFYGKHLYDRFLILDTRYVLFCISKQRKLNMDELKKAVMEKTYEENGKISLACGSAYAIAKELNVPVSRVGDFCQAENIKIRKCQLKCFN